MIFRRKRNQAEEAAEPVEAAPNEEELSPQETAVRQAEAQWAQWDEAFDREEGPFDIEEVDLDADDVERLDFGKLVLTPFEGMKLTVSVNQQQVPQAIVASDGPSAIEVSLFGAPFKSSYIPQVRRDIIAGAVQQKARTSVRQGPFGAEILRARPVATPDGKTALQITRTWLASGPSWLLRGVVFGRAAAEPTNEEATIAIEEFFANLVVRRGSEPVALGAVIPLDAPQVASLPEASSQA